MGFANQAGRARVDPSAPEAFGVCDQCSEWYNRRDLRKQYEFNGRGTYWTGYLVCRSCLDKPNPQLLTPILPPDPRPVIQPRPEDFAATDRTFGFTILNLNPVLLNGDDVLEEVARETGIATPAGVTGAPGLMTINAALTTQSALGANAARTWLLVYNPSQVPLVVSTGEAAFSGDPDAIIIGAGGAILSATAPVYQGALTVMGYVAGNPFFAFEAPAAGAIPLGAVLFP